MRILLLNGPNLGSLGRRQPEIYGSTTLSDIVEACRSRARDRGAALDHLQSNHEGVLIDRLEQTDFDAVVINPGAYGHYSYALHDALLTAQRPAVEVHISDVTVRESWRRVSVIAPATVHQVIGRGWTGYLDAIDWLVDRHLPEPAPARRMRASSRRQSRDAAADAEVSAGLGAD
jgi:3-dehydroquinate dehydratase-2